MATLVSGNLNLLGDIAFAISSFATVVEASPERIVISDGSGFIVIEGDGMTLDLINGTFTGTAQSTEFLAVFTGPVPTSFLRVEDLNLSGMDFLNFVNNPFSVDWYIPEPELGAVAVGDSSSTGSMTGDFVVEGSAFADAIITGTGNDTIFTGLGDDYVSTGGGDDFVYINEVNPGDSIVVDGGAGTDTFVTEAEFSSLTVFDDGNDTITITDQLLPAAVAAPAPAPAPTTVSLTNFELAVFADGLYSIPTGFISTRTVQTDANDDFDWETITTDVDPFEAGRSVQTTEFDNGVVRVAEISFGDVQSATEVDANERFTWATREEIYNADGSIVYAQTFDNGLSEVTTFAADGSYQEIRADLGDVKSWEITTKFVDANGNVERTVSVYDDGREVEFQYENGVRSVRFVEDTADNFDWVRHSTTYDENGVQTGRITQFDDGVVETTYVNAAGALTSRTLLDSSDNEEWFQITTTYDPSGQPFERVTQYDDGTELFEYFGAPILV